MLRRFFRSSILAQASTRGASPPNGMNFESSEIVAGATTGRDHPDLVPTVRNRRRSRRHQPHRNRSPDEAARTSRSFAPVRVNTTRRRSPPEPPHVKTTRQRLQPPFAGASIRPLPGSRCRIATEPPLPPASFPVSHRPPPLPHVTRAGDSANSAESTRNRFDLTNRLIFDQRVDVYVDIDKTHFKPFEGRLDSNFRPCFRFGVYLSSWSSEIPLLFIAKDSMID
uniref:Uncharacterized protein n=1 Tax=Brassica oleracea var. oleracea TaxID=109376 RepID=A0A0D3D4B7_BRAOL